MKTQEIVDVRVGESTQPDYGYELSDRCIITKSSNAVASGAGSKGLFSYKSTIFVFTTDYYSIFYR